MSTEQSARGRILLHSIERMLDIGSVEHTVVRIRATTAEPCEVSDRVIAHYATRSAIAGAVSAAPGMVPGWGTITAVGLTLGELTFIMKAEVEMCLALCAVHGHDVHSADTRQLALALAAVQVHHVEAGRHVMLDATEITMQSLWKYTPRELSKLVVRVLGKIACRSAAQCLGKGLLRAVPVVGSAVGYGMNALLTRRVGHAANLALEDAAVRRAASSVDNEPDGGEPRPQ